VGGFSEDALKRVAAQGEVLECREFFFEHAGVPRLALVLKMKPSGERRSNARGGFAGKPDPMEQVPVERRKLYLELKKWRNEQAQQDGVPPFVILRNELLAMIATQAPRSKQALKEIPGVGEKTVAKYGDMVIQLIPEDLPQGAAEDDGEPCDP